MFEALVSQITSVIRNAFRAVGRATHRTPWLAPVAILALLLVW